MTDRYSCVNCRYAVQASEIPSKWSGLGCKKITTLAKSGNCRVYILPSERDTCLIVEHDFLCALYEPKE